MMYSILEGEFKYNFDVNYSNCTSLISNYILKVSSNKIMKLKEYDHTFSYYVLYFQHFCWLIYLRILINSHGLLLILKQIIILNMN